MRKIPFLRITLALIAGIFTSSETSLNFCVSFIFLLFFGMSFVAWTHFSKMSLRSIKVKGFLALIFFFFLGAFAQKLSLCGFDKQHYSHHLDEGSAILAEVKEIKLGSIAKYTVYTKSILNDSSATHVRGKLLLMSKAKDLKIGDEILVKSAVKPIEEAKNEFEFCQKSFYRNKGMTHFVFSNELELISSNPPLFDTFRTKAKESINKLAISDASKAVVKAMLLGDKTDLGDISKVFRKTGTSHVLAISGLHVGIVASILFFFCSYFPKRFEKLKFLFVILGVWTFCILSGAQPSTVRASVMISCFLVGKSMNRSGLSYNYFFAAAFFMLIKNPFLIFDVGFQFSFLAIFGILYFYDFIYKALQFKGAMNYVWQLFSMSFAAQLMITPFSLYYFHEFPLLFLLTSLVAIPATFLIIAGSSVCLIFSHEIFEIFMLEEIMDWFIVTFLDLLGLFASKEELVLTNLFPDKIEMLLFYAALFSLVKYFEIFRKLYLVVFIASFISLGMYQFKVNKELSKPHVVVYAHPKDIMIDVFQSGGLTYFYEEGSKSAKSDWIAKNRRAKYQVKNRKNVPLSSHSNTILDLDNTSILILNQATDSLAFQVQDVDLVLVNNKSDFQWLDNFQGEVIDFSSNQSFNSKNNFQFIKNL